MNVEHDYKCQLCGKPATLNFQSIWTRFDITKRGGFENPETLSVEDNEFLCDKCAKEEKYI